LHHVVLDRWSRGSSPIHRCDPRAKIVALFVFLIALATTHRGTLLLSCALMVLLAAGFLWSRIPFWLALLRAALVLPFTAVFVAISWLAGDPERAVSLALKSYLSALAVVFVVSTTQLPALLAGLRRLGAPAMILEVGQFLYRYLFVISEEAQHMTKAAAARGASLRQWVAPGKRFHASAGALAVLFARAYGRAEEVHHAMLARGFSGTLPVLESTHFRPSDWLFAIAGPALILTLRAAVEGIAR
jgi:cobalt/nickel transport system permease protein